LVGKGIVRPHPNLLLLEKENPEGGLNTIIPESLCEATVFFKPL
jgi:hypothetical protein